tara:strand:- start:224 stop:424 length:201 start_codon:yes stop_codon:yes gene_type:complete
MELFAELYEIFGVSSLLIIGGIYGGRYLTGLVGNRDKRIAELETVVDKLVDKNTVVFNTMMEKMKN